MDVHVSVFTVDFKTQSNWFIQIELEKTSYPSKLKSKQKQRTDLITDPSSKFLKNHFVFKASFSNRIVLKFGAIEVASYNEKRGIDPSKCTCQGMHTLIVTKKILATLRDSIQVKDYYSLLHPSNGTETCRALIAISLEFYGIEERMIEDERVFMKIEFDRYELDEEVKASKLENIENMLDVKGKELVEWMNKTDLVKNAIRSLATDSALLKKEKDLLELENQEMQKRIQRLSNVDDIHIKIDMLITSPQGAEILRLLLEKTENRLKVQRKAYEELSANWLTIEGKKRKLEELKEEVAKVKEASGQLEFHLNTLKDQLPQALMLRDQIKSMDSLIKDFENQIAKARKVKKDKATEVEVIGLKHKHQILIEKQKQVQIILETNEGFVPIEDLEKLQIDQYNDDPESEAIKKQGERLLTEIEALGKQLSRESFRPQSRSKDPLELEVKLQAAEARIQAMQSRMTEQATSQAKEIAFYQVKLAELDAKLTKFNSL